MYYIWFDDCDTGFFLKVAFVFFCKLMLFARARKEDVRLVWVLIWIGRAFVLRPHDAPETLEELHLARRSWR